MKKFAVAVEADQISQHFGYCDGFLIVEHENEKETKRDFLPNPGHRPGFLPVFLKEKGIDTIITGGMGSRAQGMFNDAGIDVITGAAGSVDETVTAYLKDTLISSGAVCNRHDFAGDCGEEE